MKKMIRQIMALATLCWVMASCSDDTFNQEYGEGMGYLHLTLGKVDVELTSTTKADAGSLPDDLIPTTADFMIDIKQGSISAEGFPKKYSELTGGVELKAGGYTVTAYYGENETVQTTPYFSGTSTVEIYPGKSAETTINAVLANAMLVPAVSESLQNHYSAWTLTVKSGDVSMTLADKDKSDGYLFAKAEQPVNAVFEGTNLLGKETSHEWTVISSAAAQTKYVIQCEPDLSIFSNIQLTATATHTYAEGTLTGTDVALNLAANGAPLELVDDWDIQLLYNGSTIRTYSSQPQNNAIMAVTDGWPYVPQGSTLFAYIHLQTGETVELTSAVLEEIPQPEFTATVSGSTSYSVYLDPNQGPEVANTKDGSSIFDINATATIAPEILSNQNYSSILKVAYTTDSGQNSGELSYGTVLKFNSLAWQKHVLTATVSFDGVDSQSSLDCHVTGLPYRAAPPRNTGDNPWKDAAGNNEWNNDCVKLYYSFAKYPRIISPAFHIPSDIKVGISTKIYREYYWASVSKGDLCIYQFNSVSENEAEVYKRELAREETYEPTTPLEVTMTSSLPEIYIQYNYAAATGRTNVYYFNIDYK